MTSNDLNEIKIITCDLKMTFKWPLMTTNKLKMTL